MPHRYHLLSSKPHRPLHRQPPPRPDKHTDRPGWNAWFETELALKYESFKYSGIRIEYARGSPPWKGSTVDCYKYDIARRTKELMTTEGDVIELALENIRSGTFEKDWGSLTIEMRRELALEALYRGSCVRPEEKYRLSGCDFRVFCPELRIEGLVGDGEYNLINLLKRLVAHSPAGTRHFDEVFLFEHPYVTHEFRYSPAAPDVLKAWVRVRMLHRNICIADTLLGLLHAFNDRPVIPTKVVKHQPQERPNKAPEAERIFSNERLLAVLSLNDTDRSGAQARLLDYTGPADAHTDVILRKIDGLLANQKESAAPSTEGEVKNLEEEKKVRMAATDVLAEDESSEINIDMNDSAEQLGMLVSEITRVEREGKLGGRVEIEGVQGIWKDIADSVNSLSRQGDFPGFITLEADGELAVFKDLVNLVVFEFRDAKRAQLDRAQGLDAEARM
ncbi:hypothetical protein FB45DRAFT_1054468 [Roridomyces roridus]|uniref:Uncharacterized protein n=1 Tax=Roridomyces roridus TaxID=1738132 RepID=A0AAD7FX00_9AGAR|nr:hypothetical protein FB45DRAFT_1054468 [Roridomyces roridus]